MVDSQLIREARSRISSLVKKTPCLETMALSQRSGTHLHLKLETLQHTGSFKPRGALNKILQLDDGQKARGVVAASAGNHAQGVAFAARETGVQSLIVMPEATPLVKIANTEALGSRVELCGANLDESLERARELEAEHGYTFVHPFDDPAIIAGQGTVGLEILEQMPDVEAIVSPIGGGGLISGVATAIKALKPGVQVFGVQSESAPSMKRSYDAGQWQEAEVAATIAEGIALKRPGKITQPIIQTLVDGIELVSEAELESAVYELLEKGRTLTEGAGAAGYCALRQGRFRHLAGKKVVVILCGANIDMNVLDRIIERSLLQQHRLVRLRITISDRPGGLARLLDLVAEQKANILHIHQNRVFTEAAFWEVDAELILETRNREHIDQLLEALHEADYPHVEEIDRRIIPSPRSRSLTGRILAPRRENK
jgi:threonine dehydratase